MMMCVKIAYEKKDGHAPCFTRERYFTHSNLKYTTYNLNLLMTRVSLENQNVFMSIIILTYSLFILFFFKFSS